MKLLVISDAHGNADAVNAAFAGAQDADAALFAGDCAEFGRPETAQAVLNALKAQSIPVFAVSGNCDEPRCCAFAGGNIISVENSVVQWNGVYIGGSGGGSKFTGTTPNERSDEELAADLKPLCGRLNADETRKNSILILHNPPKDTAADAISSGAHVGSPSLRKIIEDIQPVLTVCGHIHESAGCGVIGKTMIVNPGALAEGKYCVIEIIQNESALCAASAGFFSL